MKMFIRFILNDMTFLNSLNSTSTIYIVKGAEASILGINYSFKNC